MAGRVLAQCANSTKKPDLQLLRGLLLAGECQQGTTPRLNRKKLSMECLTHQCPLFALFGLRSHGWHTDMSESHYSLASPSVCEWDRLAPPGLRAVQWKETLELRSLIIQHRRDASDGAKNKDAEWLAGPQS